MVHVLNLWHILLTRSGSSEMGDLAALGATFFFFAVTTVYIEDQGNLQETATAVCLKLDLKELSVGMTSPLNDLISGAFETSV